jgi:16S rRNA (uracil1498-N3)-methyltransferase
VALLVGPEGGWAPSEVQLAGSAGVVLVTLGTQTLRADAAPLVAIAALRALWGDL